MTTARFTLAAWPAQPSYRSCRPCAKSPPPAPRSTWPPRCARPTRALVAAEEGPLVTELTASGGEWVPLVNDTINPFRLKRSARASERLIASERIDIVHAQSAGGAWVASMAAARITVWLVTTLLDVPPASNLHAYWAAALARGDWVITPSNFAAAPVIARHNIPAERLTIIPRSIDIAAFDPAALDAARVEALRKAWRIPHAARILLV